tara:strand:+ start:626 stop:742 length:117 start_codon:yes stop_codon:yes gene_type:complete
VGTGVAVGDGVVVAGVSVVVAVVVGLVEEVRAVEVDDG